MPQNLTAQELGYHTPRTPESSFSGSEMDVVETLMSMAQVQQGQFSTPVYSKGNPQAVRDDMTVPPRKRMKMRPPADTFLYTVMNYCSDTLLQLLITKKSSTTKWKTKKIKYDVTRQ